MRTNGAGQGDRSRAGRDFEAQLIRKFTSVIENPKHARWKMTHGFVWQSSNGIKRKEDFAFMLDGEPTPRLIVEAKTSFRDRYLMVIGGAYVAKNRFPYAVYAAVGGESLKDRHKLEVAAGILVVRVMSGEDAQKEISSLLHRLAA
jgi:hypothetical protein